MLIQIQAVALAGVLLVSGHRLPAQSIGTAVSPPLCKHCDRLTPFKQTEGITTTIMIREDFAKSTIDAVIRDEPSNTGKPLIAIRRTALSPALVYRALASLSESRIKHNGPPLKRATMVLSSGSAFEAVPDEDRAWVANLVAQLSSAPTLDVPGVGRFPGVNFSLDKKSLRGR